MAYFCGTADSLQESSTGDYDKISDIRIPSTLSSPVTSEGIYQTIDDETFARSTTENSKTSNICHKITLNLDTDNNQSENTGGYDVIPCTDESDKISTVTKRENEIFVTDITIPKSIQRPSESEEGTDECPLEAPENETVPKTLYQSCPSTDDGRDTRDKTNNYVTVSVSKHASFNTCESPRERQPDVMLTDEGAIKRYQNNNSVSIETKCSPRETLLCNNDRSYNQAEDCLSDVEFNTTRPNSYHQSTANMTNDTNEISIPELLCETNSETFHSESDSDDETNETLQSIGKKEY